MTHKPNCASLNHLLMSSPPKAAPCDCGNEPKILGEHRFYVADTNSAPIEWAKYLKDDETPFERFMRERKDGEALMKLWLKTESPPVR